MAPTPDGADWREPAEPTVTQYAHFRPPVLAFFVGHPRRMCGLVPVPCRNRPFPFLGDGTTPLVCANIVMLANHMNAYD